MALHLTGLLVENYQSNDIRTESALKITHSRIQHGVGQGSFHSASVEVLTDEGKHHRFDYVYDCGAMKGPHPTPELKQSIKRMDLRMRPGGEKPCIDALVLSHYDQDHLNGAQDLIKQYEVKSIFLPYISPEESVVVMGALLEVGSPDTTRLIAELQARNTFREVPVTWVRSGENPLNPEVEILFRQDSTNQSAGAESPQALEVSLGDQKEMLLHIPGGTKQDAIWVLKFWNRAMSSGLKKIIEEKAKITGFPFDDLKRGGDLQKITDWLIPKKNRDKLIGVYKATMKEVPLDSYTELSGSKINNFISVCLFSGPVLPKSPYEVMYGNSINLEPSPYLIHATRGIHVGSDSVYPAARWGWFGTGDAPLGEKGVWADFSKYFRRELKQAISIQVPHHGAAPKTGSRFFNSDLITEYGMNAVISVGRKNNYGHPAVAVIKELMSRHSNIYIITEEAWLGFQEVLIIRSKGTTDPVPNELTTN